MFFENCVHCFDHIHLLSPNSSQIHILPFPHKFVFPRHQGQFCCLNILGCEAFNWNMVYLSGATLLIKTDPLLVPVIASWQLPISEYRNVCDKS